MRRASVGIVVAVVLAGGALATYARRHAAAQTLPSGTAEPDAGHVAVAPCGPNDATLFFHGRAQQGYEIVSRGVCAPRLLDDGEPGFWCDESSGVLAPSARVLVGYSAGRIPVLRRLKTGTTTESTVALLDPSWSDGPRYDGESGPDIVARWLLADPARKFVLVYAPDAAGYREYLALREGAVAARVLACAVSTTHDAMPRAVGTEFLRDPARWLARICPLGTYAPEDASADAPPDASARDEEPESSPDAAAADAATSSEP